MKASCGCVNDIGGGIRFCRVHEAAFDLLQACSAVDIYFKALCEQWAAHDGRVVSESGIVLDASKSVERLCELAAQKVLEALARAVG